VVLFHFKDGLLLLLKFPLDRLRRRQLDLRNSLADKDRRVFFFDLNFRRQLCRESAQICCEEDAVSPSSFFAPESSEMVANGIVGRFRKTFKLAFAKFVVTLGYLPNCMRASEQRLAERNIG